MKKIIFLALILGGCQCDHSEINKRLDMQEKDINRLYAFTMSISSNQVDMAKVLNDLATRGAMK